ncbi:MAG: RnfABCDGE type electron transport complex subunit G [Planctomycetota bacterium]|nr:RnfABCDGE type electron transport complex subunit G [Planctomycetota bacterium]
MRDFIRMVSVLFIVCGLAAASLAVVNAITKEPIAGYEKRYRDAALREVFPDADEFLNDEPDRVWEALREGQKTGHVFLTQVQGYSGPITLMFGTDSSGAITGLRILNHTETPGLGAKITTAQFRDQFKNKRSQQLILSKDDSARGQIHAITGATFSTRAVTKALRSRLESFNGEKSEGDK